MGSKKKDRKAKLGLALKANLKRRKQQAQGRAATANPPKQ
jgi:hypothetical protein